MTDDGSADGGSIPIDRYPDPAVSYIDDGRLKVRTTNEAFDSTFGPIASETPVSELLDHVEVATLNGSPELSELLETDDSTTVAAETAAGEYLVRVLPPDDGSCGYVLLIAAEGFGIDRIASVLSHDLRNPLDVAKARLRAAHETGEDEHFERVWRAHDRMERIIEDVLTLARGEAVVDPAESIDLEAVVESAWSTVETADATLTLADDLPTTVADRDRAERLFENLFRNSVEHGDDPDITVGRLGDPAKGVYTADDGPGIDPDERSAVFDPGYSTHDHGTGLGLSIVERIAHAHGWTVDVTSADSGGARIEIRGMEER